MLISTTNNIEGKSILEYKDIVFGETVTGVNLVKDFMAGVRDLVGGKSATYENELIKAREYAINEMKARASNLGANAIVGIKIDYEVLGASNGMFMVTASGTAVVVE